MICFKCDVNIDRATQEFCGYIKIIENNGKYEDEELTYFCSWKCVRWYYYAE